MQIEKGTNGVGSEVIENFRQHGDRINEDDSVFGVGCHLSPVNEKISRSVAIG